jgi:predicted permease
MTTESLILDTRYALRGMRRSPLFAASVAGTMGLGLGILCSAFAIVNAYVLKPVGLPGARELYALSWDSSATRYHQFRLSDFDALRDGNPIFSALAAGNDVTAMQGDIAMAGQAVTGNYFQLLGARAAIGRTLLPDDAAAPGAHPVVVLSDDAWRSRYGADPAIVGKDIVLGRRHYQVVGVTGPGSALPGTESVRFWVPLTMASAFAIPDPWRDIGTASLFVVGRLRADVTESQARAWFDSWLRQRFPAGLAAAPLRAHVESRATRIPRNTATLTMLALIVGAFGLVLLVACANVTNMILARGLGRQRELGLRLSLGASRARLVRQLVIESLVLAVPAAAVGLAITLVTARVLPLLILRTLPDGLPPAAPFLAPLDPDIRVLALLLVSAVISAVIVGLSPAIQVTRGSLARAVKGELGTAARISSLRTSLVALQIGACVLFMVGAISFASESRRLTRSETGLAYERVVDVRAAEQLRGALALRLAADPSVERIAAAWRPPFAGPLHTLRVSPSGGVVEQAAGFTVVSPEYFALFDIRLQRGRLFTPEEAQQNAAVVVVSEATARKFWPGLDAIGQALDVPPAVSPSKRQPAHRRVHVVGITADAVNGAIVDGVDPTCVYFPTTLDSPGEMSLFVRARADVPALRRSIAAAAQAAQADATFQIYGMEQMLGLQFWALRAFSTAAALLATLGLILSFSGTYSVVAFVVTQRMREFGIRMALGATAQRIVVGVVGNALRVATVGVAGGLIVAVLLARVFDAAIEMMPAFGPQSYVIGATVVLVAAVMAALVPSVRTGRIDPSAALRAE